MSWVVGIFTFCVAYSLADGLYYRFSAKQDHITEKLASQFGFAVAVLATFAAVAYANS